MAFQPFQLGDEPSQGMSEINLIPLIDIMLVLMIIFLVTATVLNPTVVLDLPKTSAQVNPLPKTVIQISIDANGQLFWDHEALTLDALGDRFAQQARLDEPPVIQLRADKDSRYDTVAQVLALASQHHLTRIGFVHQP